ncbi:MAG: hypothetical protein R2818_13230 [Flavobacteriales bacterium]
MVPDNPDPQAMTFPGGGTGDQDRDPLEQAQAKEAWIQANPEAYERLKRAGAKVLPPNKISVMKQFNALLRSFVPTGVTSVFLTLVMGSAVAQCPNNNTLLAGGTVTPNCPGTTTVPCITGGEYALVSVTSGRVYTFSTCGAVFDTQITLYNNSGGGSSGVQ